MNQKHQFSEVALDELLALERRDDVAKIHAGTIGAPAPA
jgi:hypothetical protein